MVDYKDMYFKLFGETAKAIEILQKVQLECEEMFMSSTDAKISIPEPENENDA